MGQLLERQQIKRERHDLFMNEWSFRNACYKGDLEVAQRLYQNANPNININSRNNFAFRYACVNGHLAVAQWLYQISNQTIHISCQIMNDVGVKGHLEVIQWLYQLMFIDEQYKYKYKYKYEFNYNYAFRYACVKGQLKVAQWLYQISNQSIDICAKDHYALRWACYYGRLEVMKWLQSLKPYLYVIHYKKDGTGNAYVNAYVLSKKEAKWQQRKVPLWLASNQSPNKNSLFYKIPQDVSRYIIQSYL